MYKKPKLMTYICLLSFLVLFRCYQHVGLPLMRELAAKRPEGEIFPFQYLLSLRHGCAVPPPSSEGG